MNVAPTLSFCGWVHPAYVSVHATNTGPSRGKRLSECLGNKWTTEQGSSLFRWNASTFLNEPSKSKDTYIIYLIEWQTRRDVSWPHWLYCWVLSHFQGNPVLMPCYLVQNHKPSWKMSQFLSHSSKTLTLDPGNANTCMLNVIHKLRCWGLWKLLWKGTAFEKFLQKTRINFQIITEAQRCSSPCSPNSPWASLSGTLSALSSNTEWKMGLTSCPANEADEHEPEMCLDATMAQA